MKVAEAFQGLLCDFNTEALRKDPAVIYGMWRDFRLAYMNPAWFQFAAGNGGEPCISRDWPLGRSILDAVPLPIQPHFVKNVGRVLTELRPWVEIFECSSATLFRKFQMTVYPLGAGAGLLIVNSPVIETPHDRTAAPAIEALYRDPAGIMHQCAYCRRFQRQPVQSLWDWVPKWVNQVPPRTSHGICPPCFEFYSSDRQLAPGRGSPPFTVALP